MHWHILSRVKVNNWQMQEYSTYNHKSILVIMVQTLTDLNTQHMYTSDAGDNLPIRYYYFSG